MDISGLVSAAIAPLGSLNATDLSEWCSTDELYAFADEAAKRLAHRCGLWVDWSAGNTVAGTAIYQLPVGHLATLHVAVNGAALRSASARELLARDRAWADGVGKPVRRFSMDAVGTTAMLIYGTPAAAQALTVVYLRWQPTISATHTQLPVPAPVADYLTFAMIGEARRKESEQSMPEVEAHCDERLALFEQVFQHYWGGEE